MDYLGMVRDFCSLRLSQRRDIAKHFGTEVIPGEDDLERVKKTVKAVADQGRQAEFAKLVAAAKSE